MDRAPWRHTGVDALRVLGILAIIAGHVWDSRWTREGLYTWHVPLFFVLTGYFWTKGRPIRTELLRRFQTLLIPYIFWLVVIGAPYLVYEKHKTGSISGELIGDLARGGAVLDRPFSAFWFVTALFFAALIVRMAENGRWGYPLWLTAATVGLAACYCYPEIMSRDIPLALGTAIPATLFIAFGMLLSRAAKHIPWPAAIGCLLVGVSAILIATRVSPTMSMKDADFGRPVISVLVACAVSAGLILIFSSLPIRGAAGSAATGLAEVGLGAILAHAGVFFALRMPTTGNLGYFCATAVLSWTLALALHRTVLSSVAIGTQRAARHTR